MIELCNSATKVAKNLVPTKCYEENLTVWGRFNVHRDTFSPYWEQIVPSKGIIGSDRAELLRFKDNNGVLTKSCPSLTSDSAKPFK